jgi:hypothetical protein
MACWLGMRIGNVFQHRSRWHLRVQGPCKLFFILSGPSSPWILAKANVLVEILFMPTDGTMAEMLDSLT